MTEHRYPLGSLVLDYVRAGIGLCLTGGPLLLADPSRVAAYILGGLAALFIVYGGRTAVRHMTTIRLSATGIHQAGPVAAEIAWRDLAVVHLRYFSTRRDRKRGWMQLKVTGTDGQRIRIDSQLDAFDALVAAVAGGATARGLDLDETTRTNLQAMGPGASRRADVPEFG